jgi:hypothetical protein
MMKHVFAAAMATMLVTALSSPPVLAQDKKAAGAEKRKPSAALTAMRDRQKKCGTEWKEAKAAGKVPKGQRWPQYWSACNKRLKAAGA